MIKMTLREAANILGLAKIMPDKMFQGISIDTRTLKPGNLFVALSGTQVDGHHFVEEARLKGATAALVTKQVDSNLPQLIVKNNEIALGQLSISWRNQFNIPFIAVTGSNGKTTIKDMIAAILVAHCDNDMTSVLATHGSFNNHLGLPLTLANLNANHRYAVIEMGMNHFGEIEYLSKLTRPSVAVITNAAASHLEGVGDLAGVARAKSEIFLGMDANGTAILNRDDAFFNFWHEQIGNRPYLTFGFHPDADIRATIHDGQQISLHTPKGNFTLEMFLLGKHNVINALAATAVGLVIGVKQEAIKKGLEYIKPVPRRLQLIKLPNDVNLIDDTYNANPFSLQAAVDTLINFPGKKILVLGDMKELGSEAKSLHQLAGEKIRQAGINYLFTYGDLSANTSLAFGEGAFHFNDQAKLVTALKPFLYNQTTILVKGSKTMHMEKVITELIQELQY